MIQKPAKQAYDIKKFISDVLLPYKADYSDETVEKYIASALTKSEDGSSRRQRRMTANLRSPLQILIEKKDPFKSQEGDSYCIIWGTCAWC